MIVMFDMKNINIVFTDEEHEKLTKAKGELSWHKFILTLLKEEEE